MKRTIQILAWLVVAGYAAIGVGFVMMAIDGYDYWDPNFPPPNSLADTGYYLATFTQLAALALLATNWILLSIWTVGLRDKIPTTWKHSKAAVWLWWLVPVASYWMPRDVYLEVSRSARPSDLVHAKRVVNRWWISTVLFLVAVQLGYVGFGPTFLAIAAVAAALLCGVAAYDLGTMISAIANPEITFETAPDYGETVVPIRTEAPTVPGWYNDPSGQSSHQAYWDGGRYSGAIRPDPRLFPTQSRPGAAEKDRLKTWLIVFGIVFTLASIAFSVIQAFSAIEEEGGFDIATLIGIL